MRAVALGGGHGLHVTLRALRRLTDDVTAVVTVADDGGSSGRLRRELGLLPPGDLRQALVALADDDEAAWSSVFQHRFGGDGPLAGHAVGNLMLAGLIEVLDDPLRALEEAGRLLGIRGRVLPMSTEPLDIEADVVGLDSRQGTVRRIRGQVAVATTPGRVLRIRLHSTSVRPTACAAALDAVRGADVVLLGPGSWFTSVLPHLLLPDLAEALVSTSAGKIVVVNLTPQPGETSGFSPERHLDVLCEHAPSMRVDAVVADAGAVPDPAELRRSAKTLGARVLLDEVAIAGDRERHDPDALAASLRRALGR
ncbi:MAG: gluconeogenesis factor YvcK family protein [Sciscionella sp.]